MSIIFMYIFKLLILLFSALFIPKIAYSNQSLASTIEVFAFPQEGQSSEEQSKDEATCYSWAVDQSGDDPFDLNKQLKNQQNSGAKAQQNANQSTRGAGAKGAARGAALGVLIEDDHEGAEKGAVAGAVLARRKAKREKRNTKKAAQKTSESQIAATEQQIESFRKAFSVCLEAKDYLVKY